jgi:FKBP-type peptidyl-prolyl cis-trans isomerase
MLGIHGHSVVSPGVSKRTARAAGAEQQPGAARPSRGWVCEVQYVGWLCKARPAGAPPGGCSFAELQGDEFDRSMSAYPFKVTMGASSVVAGFEEAIMSMQVGERAEFWLRGK